MHNTQDMLHALCIRHPCAAAVTLTAKCIAQAHTDIRRLEFLPYHFLLGSVGDLGMLRFQVSIHHICTPQLYVHTNPFDRLCLPTLAQSQLLGSLLAGVSDSWLAIGYCTIIHNHAQSCTNMHNHTQSCPIMHNHTQPCTIVLLPQVCVCLCGVGHQYRPNHCTAQNQDGPM